MKKIILLLLVLLPVVSNASSVTFKFNKLWYNGNNSTGEAELISYSIQDNVKYSGDIIIPDTVNYNGKNYRVTSIGYSAFFECENLTSIVISNGVTKIPAYTFYGCTNLQSVTIGKGVESIEVDAFYGCKNIREVYFYSKKVTGGWLGWNDHVKHIYLSDDVEEIGQAAFMRFSGLTSVVIGKNVSSIDGTSFTQCDNLRELTINSKNIGDYWFKDNQSLQIVNIGDSVRTIGVSAFNSVNVKSLRIPDGVTSIGNFAFYNCPQLVDLYVGNSVKSIGQKVFYGCNSIEKLTLGESLEEIGRYSFGLCPSLYKIEINNKVPPTCAEGVFSNVNKKSCRLYVPYGSFDKYCAAEIWDEFLYCIEGPKPTEKCATPKIMYQNGQLSFESETDGVEFISSIKNDDIKDYNTANVQLCVTYSISVYATKNKFEDSEVAKATLCWIDVEPKSEGLTDTDIANVKALPVVVQASNGTITVSGADDGTMVEVYGISGTKLGEAKTTLNKATIHTDAQAGSVVIVKVGNKAIKIRI